MLQAKLAVSSPGDAYEQEADRVAEEITAARDSGATVSELCGAPGPAQPLERIQRACSCGGTCADCREEEKPRIQRMAATQSRGGDAEGGLPPIVDEVLRSPGQPLDRATRAFMEPRFGRDFGGVRVHADARAAESARAVNALAYTLGRNIVFGEGHFAPQTPGGKRLLAHELTHVVQQSPAGAGPANLQRKVHIKEPDRWLFVRTWKWVELTGEELHRRVDRLFPGPADRRMAREIADDMAGAADDFKFENDQELRTELFKRMRTSQLMRESQRVHGGLAQAFGYPNNSQAKKCRPDKRDNPRVNKAAEKYWGPVQYDARGSYYFSLSADGRKDPYEALKTLFTPQRNICDRTLIHCDYLASVVHFRVFAESIGIKEFNRRVATGVIRMTLKWNGFADIERNIWRSPESTSLQEVRPSSERDLVIGDHVVFWNRLTYDLINTVPGRRHAWRLENAILIGKRAGGEDVFLGHGSGERTNPQMRQKLSEEYNAVVAEANHVIRQAKSASTATRSRAQAEMVTDYPHIKPVGTEWRIRGTNLYCNKPFDEKLKTTNQGDPELAGLRDPCNLSKMNWVKRPVESR